MGDTKSRVKGLIVDLISLKADLREGKVRDTRFGTMEKELSPAGDAKSLPHLQRIRLRFKVDTNCTQATTLLTAPTFFEQ